MKAAVCYEGGKLLVVEDIIIDPPKPGEVKARLAATAICHSDIHALRGEFGPRFPGVAGHECAGYIDEVGEGVTSVKPGDSVLVTMVPSCGRCYYCTHGEPHLCISKWPLDTESRFHNKQGQALKQMMKVGGMAEYTVVDQSQVVKIPQDMPMDRAALLSCGVITGFGSVVWRAQVKALSSVVVIGTGGVGLNAIQGAAYSGAYPIIAVDILDSKLEAAKKFGATHGVNAKQVDPIEAVKQLTSGLGAEYVFATVGSTAAMKQGYYMARRRGMLVLVGLTSPNDNLCVYPNDWIHSEIVITASNMGSVNLQENIPQLISLYKSGKLKLDELITNRYPLAQINEAIEEVERGAALRNVIVFK
jgi:S-(hydroxymethyl)glutathione dehydrogenase / alcohol dehydrogenase